MEHSDHTHGRKAPRASGGGSAAGDLLRALHELAPVEPAAYLSIARLIDPAWPGPGTLESAGGSARVEEAVGEDLPRAHDEERSPSDVRPEPESEPQLVSPPDQAADIARAREVVPSTISRIREESPSRPAWLEEPAEFLLPEGDGADEPELDALMVSGQAHGILSALLATLVETRKLDLDDAVRRIARDEPLRPPPLTRAPMLAPRIQLLLDRSQPMLPFLGDLRALAKDTERVVGAERLDVLRFAGCPTRGAGAGPRSTWSADYVLRLPPPRSCIVVATDLGIGFPPASAPAEWIAFAQAVARAGCRLLALVPFGPERWPLDLVHELEIVHWDRSTTAGRTAAFIRRRFGAQVALSASAGARVRSKAPDAKRLASLAAFAVRVDPPLLRTLRLELMPEADAGTEADVWAQEIVRFRGPDGFVFDPEAADALRRGLALEDVAAYEAAWRTTEQLHRHLAPEIRVEEELRYLHRSRRSDTSDRIGELLRRVTATMVSEKDDIAGWAARAMSDLPQSIRESEEGLMVSSAANVRLPGRLVATPDLPTDALPDWVAWVIPDYLPRVPVGVELLEGEIEFSQPPAEGAYALELPATRPLAIEVSTPGSVFPPQRVDLEPGTTRRVPVEGDVILRTATGQELAVGRRAPTRRARQKVAVLGGGMSAIAAAFELTAPELEGQYAVTVYQPGWRLGGKCASGRGGTNQRIEQHGLHVWFGFYANAFNLIQRCYAEWAPPPDSPLRTWQDAFMQCNDIVLFEHWRGQWTPWHLHLPPDDLAPGTGHEVTPPEFLARLLDWLRAEWGMVHRGAIPEASMGSARRLRVPVIEGLMARLGRRVEELDRGDAGHLLELAHMVAEQYARDRGSSTDVETAPAQVATLLTSFKRWLFDEVLESVIDNADMRRFAILLDFWTVTISGMVADRVFEVGFGPLNDEDLRGWLTRHGAESLTLEQASFLRGLYDIAFAYRDGDKRRPDLAAGKALQALIRIVLEYRGAMLWKLRAGAADTLFTPLYDVLRRRGVRFEFFHHVTRLGVASDGSSVTSIEIQPQAPLKAASYDPVIAVGGLQCWPSEPKWQLLEDGDKLRELGVNFEHESNPLGLTPIVLQAGLDFDEVVLAISVGALPPICEELAAANERFRRMLEGAETVMTENIQLWLARLGTELGWPYEDAIASAYVSLADTYANMPHLLTREQWGTRDEPADIAYLSGVLWHDGLKTQAEAEARVRENALGFLRENAAQLWPEAFDASTGEFDWNVLAGDGGADGPERLAGQFLRANFQPSDRYVMTRAGSVRNRLRADESGFSNLKLAGDWTRNGIDGGSVEAAVTSGMQAARAISGRPRNIRGERGWLVDD